jgi:SAM-dependent methyltransferase
MSPPPHWRCPACGELLATDPAGRIACRGGGHVFAETHGIADLRLRPGIDEEPRPLRSADLSSAFEARAAGQTYVSALEAVLLALDVVGSDRLMQILGEGRGAWFALLGAKPGAILFLGNALSGAVAALAQTGWTVTVVDRSPDRLRFEQYRDTERYPGRTIPLLAGDAPALPFADASFDAVVQEAGFPGAAPVFAQATSECLRVARDDVVLIGNNRLGYKRSTGRRSIYRMPGPFEWLRDAALPREGERTLLGWRRALADRGAPKPRAYALYPHASDFTHVVAIDGAFPSLTIGPGERRNRLKVVGRALGLFPVFTPSFLVHARRAGPAGAPESPPRIDRMLDAIAERTGEPRAELVRLVSTRGQSAVIHTRSRGGGEAGAPGSWTLYVPFLPSTVSRAKRRHEALTSVRKRFPWLPTPEPLFFGEADGVLVACERRLPGIAAAKIGGDRSQIARMLSDASAHFARLFVRASAPFTSAEFDALIGDRFALVERHAGVPSTAAELRRLRDEARERLVGRAIPRVFHHGDLRSKHVQVDREDGKVIGYLDWSVSEDEFLPYLDLVHLVVHERKQADDLTAERAWKLVRDRRDLRSYEREALERHRRAIELDDEVARAIEAIYPVLVAAMAERSWEYSRPRWLHRQFGL